MAIATHDTIEARTNEIEFADIPWSVLEYLIVFLKTDNVPEAHMSNNVVEFELVADKFEIPTLLSLVESPLKKSQI